MKAEPITIVGPDCIPQELAPGDRWPLPFRGSRFTVSKVEKRLCVTWTYRDALVQTSSYPAEIAGAVRRMKNGNGSFRVTPHGAIITKVPTDEDGGWGERYVGRYTGDLHFASVDNDPSNVELGMYWTGFPFVNGETWYVSALPQSRSHLQWNHFGVRFVSTRAYSALSQLYLSIRPRGGRLYINENQHLWMNLPDSEVSMAYRAKFQDLQGKQIDDLSAAGNTPLLRLLQMRIEITRTRPVYLGHISEFDHGEPPWTSFSLRSAATFGGGGEDDADDHDHRS